MNTEEFMVLQKKKIFIQLAAHAIWKECDVVGDYHAIFISRCADSNG